ncbi:hypothetical protein [Mycobacteroides immunogenum]|uniref:hypothetical protein n=1 Tax=Mycobacteroides immunogenum TaxID=83262 RepID=UPI003899432B
MGPGFQISEPPKVESGSVLEHTNDLVMALTIAALFIALGMAKFAPFWLIHY